MYILRNRTTDRDAVFAGDFAFEDMENAIREDVLTVKAISHKANGEHIYFVI